MKVSFNTDKIHSLEPDFIDEISLKLQTAQIEVMQELKNMNEDPLDYQIVVENHRDFETGDYTTTLKPKRIRFDCERCGNKVPNLHQTIEGEVCFTCMEEIDEQEETNDEI